MLIARDNFLILYLSIVLICIFLLPRVYNPFWIEDFLFPFCLIVFAGLITMNYKLKFSFELLLILILQVLTFFTTAIFSANKGFYTSFMLIAKELEFHAFYLLFLVTFMNCRQRFRKWIDFSLSFVILFSSAYVLYQVMVGSIGYYGIGHIAEQSNSSLSGFVYYSLMVISIFFYSKSNKSWYVVAAIIFLIGAMLTGSRTAQLVSLFFLFASYVFLTKLSLTKIFVLSILIGFISICFVFSNTIFLVLYDNSIDNEILSNSLRRFASLFNFYDHLNSSRFIFWEKQISLFDSENIFQLFFGGGRGFTHSIDNNTLNLGLGADSGYLKHFLELGLIGSLFYYSIPFYFLLVSYRFRVVSKSLNFYTVYVISLFIYEISFENLQTSKGGMIFWLFSAYFMSLSRNIRADARGILVNSSKTT